MIRGIKTSGGVIVGLTRSSIERLLEGHSVTSPAYEGHRPEIVIVFAEDDKALRARLVSDQLMRATTIEKDFRSS